MEQKYSKVAGMDWNLYQNDDGSWSNQSSLLALMMDIRAELRAINQVLGCGNFQQIPFKLERIARNTVKAKRKPKVKR